ncbi:MAG: S-layer homology domain-containing protein [Clostridia bacterium]|nr:S-layer homology domain-containing protein [Clostridia bacterium]
MKKICILLVLVMLLSCISVTNVFAAKRDAYAGFTAYGFDETTSTKCTTNGKLGSSGSKQTYTYKDVDFGEDGADAVIVGIDTVPQYDTTFNLYIDDPKGTPIASILTEGAGWGVVVEQYAKLTGIVKGRHDVYLVTGGDGVNFYNITFNEKSMENAVYNRYDPNKSSFSDISDSEYKEDIEIINQLGFLPAIENDMYYPKMPVTRGKFAEAACRMLGDSAIAGKSGRFPDVNSETPYANAINTMAEMNYMNGSDDGNFYPEGFITAHDAALVMCRMLGYQIFGISESNVMTLANRYELLDGVPVDAVLTEETLARVIKNAIDASIYDPERIYSNGRVVYKKSDDGILSITSNIFKVEGLISESGISGLSTPETSLKIDEIKVDGETYLIGETIANTLLGFECELYYKKDGGKKTVLAVAPLSNIDLTDIDTLHSKVISISATEVKYIPENVGKEKVLKIAEGTHILYNGKAIDDRLSNLISENFRGYVRYIENLESTVLVIDEYKNIIIDAAYKKERMIYDSIEPKAYYFKTEEYDTFYTMDGVAVEYKQIALGSGALLYESKNKSGKKLARIEIIPEKVTGTFNLRTDEKVYIDGKPYTLASELKETVVLGEYATCIVNMFDEIIDIKYIAGGNTTAERVAWFVNYNNQSDPFNSEKKVRLLDRDNSINEYILSEKCTIDGRKMQEGENVFSEDMLNQPIRYKLANGKITMVDTIKPGEGGDNDKLESAFDKESFVIGRADRVLLSSKDMTNKCFISQDVAIICQPENETNPENYYWIEYNSLDSSVRISAYSYDFSFGMVDIMINHDVRSEGASRKSMVVASIGAAVNTEGDECIMFKTMNGTEDFTYIIDDKYPELQYKASALKIGDIIVPYLDKDKKLADFKLMFINGTAESRTYSYEGELREIRPSLSATSSLSTGTKNSASYERYVYGTVAERNGQYLKVTPMGTEGTDHIYLNTSKGVTIGNRSASEVHVVNGIEISSIMPGDVAVFEFIDRTLNVVYIIEDWGDYNEE